MQLKRKKRQAGDTLVEVLLAFSIFGAAATTITRAMNEGYQQMFANGQQSQVQALMRGQLAIIQAAHDAEVKDPNSGLWETITGAIADSPQDDESAVNADGCTYTQHKNRLYFTTGSGGAWTQPQIRPKVTDPAHLAVSPRTVTPTPENGAIWVEAKYTPPDADSRGFYDFYVKSCWSDSRIARQLKTVSRLYDLVPATGESSQFTPNPPNQNPIPVDPVVMRGNEYSTGKCVPTTPLEGNEFTQTRPTNALFSSPSGMYPCGPIAGNPNTVYTCTNYDIEYPSQVTFAGRYQMTLSHLDAVCGGGAEVLSAGGAYSYRLEVYKNGTWVGTMNINPDSPSSTFPFDLLSPGDTIGFRWWNNRFFPTSPGKDPDFTFTNIRLDYVQP